jgi:uncharacterized protein
VELWGGRVMINIRAYQEAYESTVSKLKANNQVIAVVVYGSMVSGDVWEESDIDFLIITNEKNKTENIYTKACNIPVHINYLSKDVFISSYKNLLKGGTFHKAFFTGKLVYCSDDDIRNIHMSARFYGDRDINIRNVDMLTHLVNSLHYTKKYYTTHKFETSYQWCIETLKNYARLLMNMNGHITDKDILSFAVNMDDNIEKLFKLFNSNMSVRDKIGEILSQIDEFIDLNIEVLSQPIVDFLREKRTQLSIQDIQNSNEFRLVDGDLNGLLERLSDAGIVKEGMRRFNTYGDEYLINEIVYYVE